MTGGMPIDRQPNPSQNGKSHSERLDKLKWITLPLTGNESNPWDTRLTSGKLAILHRMADLLIYLEKEKVVHPEHAVWITGKWAGLMECRSSWRKEISAWTIILVHWTYIVSQLAHNWPSLSE